MEPVENQPSTSPSAPTPGQSFQPPASNPPAKKPKGTGGPSTYHVSWPVVFVVLILLIISLGGWGYLRYARLQSQLGSKVEALNNKQKELDQTKADLATASKVVNQVTGASATVTISEWGVTFTPGADLVRFTYVMNQGQVVPSTTSLMELAWSKATAQTAAGDYLCSPADYPLGYMARGKATDKVPVAGNILFKDYADTKSNKDVIQVGEYYYVVIGPQSACSTDKSVSDLETKQTAALKTALQTMVLAR